MTLKVALDCMAQGPFGRVCALCAHAENSKSDLGPMLGPIGGLGGESSCYVHRWCALWSPEVYQTDEGTIRAVGAAVRRGRAIRCTHCGKRGATIGCALEHCAISFHLPCAHEAGCTFQPDAFTINCPKHSKRKAQRAGTAGGLQRTAMPKERPGTAPSAGPMGQESQLAGALVDGRSPPWSPARMARPLAAPPTAPAQGEEPVHVRDGALQGAEAWGGRRTPEVQPRQRRRVGGGGSSKHPRIDVGAVVGHVLRGRGALARVIQEALARESGPGAERVAAEEDEADWRAKETARGAKDIVRLQPVILAGRGGGPEAIAAAREYAESHRLTGPVADAALAGLKDRHAAAPPLRIWGAEAPGFESLGGMGGVVRALREMALLPLLQPGLMGRLGVQPPRGILLHGVPGAGKTAAVRALAGECARAAPRPVALFVRKGADCLGKYAGDAERTLRLLFERARALAPSIIFLDELDALAPARSVRASTSDQVHASVVSTLLSVMDGLADRGQVLVIGATNRPDSLDPALRRPGRFDREVRCGLPDTAGRASILSAVTRAWSPTTPPDLLADVAAATQGYAGADLAALACSAVLAAARRVRGPAGLLPKVLPQRPAPEPPTTPGAKVAGHGMLEGIEEVGAQGQAATQCTPCSSSIGTSQATSTASSDQAVSMELDTAGDEGAASDLADVQEVQHVHAGGSRQGAAVQGSDSSLRVPVRRSRSRSRSSSSSRSSRSRSKSGSRSPDMQHTEVAAPAPGGFLAALSGIGSEFGEGVAKVSLALAPRAHGASRSRSRSGRPPTRPIKAQRVLAAAQQQPPAPAEASRGLRPLEEEEGGGEGEGEDEGHERRVHTQAKRQKTDTQLSHDPATCQHHQVHWADEAAAAAEGDNHTAAGARALVQQPQEACALGQRQEESQEDARPVSSGPVGSGAAGAAAAIVQAATTAPAAQVHQHQPQAPAWLEGVQVEACDWQSALAAAPLPAAKRESLAVLGGGEAGALGEALPHHLAPLLTDAVGALIMHVLRSGLAPLPPAVTRVGAVVRSCDSAHMAPLAISSALANSMATSQAAQSGVVHASALEQVLVEAGAADRDPYADDLPMEAVVQPAPAPPSVTWAPAAGSAAAAAGCRVVRVLVCDPVPVHSRNSGTEGGMQRGGPAAAAAPSPVPSHVCGLGDSELAARGLLRLLGGGAQVVRLALPSLVVAGEGDPVAGAVATVASAVAAARTGAGGSGAGGETRLLVLHLPHVEMWTLGAGGTDGDEDEVKVEEVLCPLSQHGSLGGSAGAARGAGSAHAAARSDARSAAAVMSAGHSPSPSAAAVRAPVPGASPSTVRRLGAVSGAVPHTPTFHSRRADHTNVVSQHATAQLLPLTSPTHHVGMRTARAHSTGATLHGQDVGAAMSLAQYGYHIPARTRSESHACQLPHEAGAGQTVELALEVAGGGQAGQVVLRAPAMLPTLWSVLEQLVAQVATHQPLLLLATSRTHHTKLPPALVAGFGGPPAPYTAGAIKRDAPVAASSPITSSAAAAAIIAAASEAAGGGRIVGDTGCVVQLASHAADAQPMRAAVLRAARSMVQGMLLPRLLAISSSGTTSTAGGIEADATVDTGGAAPAAVALPGSDLHAWHAQSTAEHEAGQKLQAEVQARIRAMASALLVNNSSAHRVRAPRIQSQLRPLTGGSTGASGQLSSGSGHEEHTGRQPLQPTHASNCGYESLADVAVRALNGSYHTLDAFRAAVASVVAGARAVCPHRAAAGSAAATAAALAVPGAQPHAVLRPSTPAGRARAGASLQHAAAAATGVTGGAACCVGAAAAAVWMDAIDAGCAAAQQALGLLDPLTAQLLRRLQSSCDSTTTQPSPGEAAAPAPYTQSGQLHSVACVAGKGVRSHHAGEAQASPLLNTSVAGTQAAAVAQDTTTAEPVASEPPPKCGGHLVAQLEAAVSAALAAEQCTTATDLQAAVRRCTVRTLRALCMAAAQGLGTAGPQNPAAVLDALGAPGSMGVEGLLSAVCNAL